MKIRYRRTSPALFRDLRVGEVCEYRGRVCLKLPSSKVPGIDGDVNTLSLDGNNLFRTPPNAHVNPRNVENPTVPFSKLTAGDLFVLDGVACIVTIWGRDGTDDFNALRLTDNRFVLIAHDAQVEPRNFVLVEEDR